MRTSFDSVEELAVHGSKSYSERRRNPQVTAWLVLATSFAVFWLLVAGAFLVGKHYYETASVPGGATLSIESGIVLFRDSVTSTLINASNNLELREGDDLLVGQGARASLALFDGTRIQLYPGSQLAFRELRKSRFHDGFTRIGVAVDQGSVRLEVARPSSADGSFTAFTPVGSANLQPGNFGIDVEENQTRISSRQGLASVSGKDAPVALKAGEKALLTVEGVSGPLPEGDSLVKNGDFAQGFSQWGTLDNNEPGRPIEPGQRTLVTEDVGDTISPALHISRLSPRAIHNETGLSQPINKDVSDYQSLKLHANIKVTGQSLSGGGYMGYEYPLMIRVRYRDATGGQIDWTHGFFASNPEGRPTPNGEQVPRGEWIDYDGDLMEISPRPVYVISVEVLGAGHTFDGSIANVQIVGK